MGLRDLLAAVAVEPGCRVVTWTELAVGRRGRQEPRVGGRKTAQRQRWAGWSALLRAGRMAFLKNPKRLISVRQPLP
jgi:hypothetical protein